MDLSGFPVVVIDTAGIRNAMSSVEKEGIRRAVNAGRAADLALWLVPVDETIAELPRDIDNGVIVRTKSDLRSSGWKGLSCSVQQANGLDELIAFLLERVSGALSSDSFNLITRYRHRKELSDCAEHLKNSGLRGSREIVFAAEDLRLASDCIGRLTGRIDVEDLLEVIFSEFCIDK